MTRLLNVEDDTEFGFPAHHPGVRFSGFFERVLFNHGPYTRPYREAQSVFGVGWDPGYPSLDSFARRRSKR